MNERTVTSFEALSTNGETTPRRGLTAGQMRKVRAAARSALAEYGIEASIHADHLKTVDGRTFGLHNLVSKCRASGLPETEWGLVAKQHFDAILTAYPEEPGEVPADELERNTFARVQVEQALPRDWHPHYRYVRRLGGGLIELLAHRDAEADMVRWLRDEDMAGRDVDHLREIGLANVRAVQPDEHTVFESGIIRFHVVSGASGFLASKVLVLPDLLADVLGRRGPWTDGVAVALPSRYEIAFAPVGPGILGGTAGLWSYASWAFSHRAGPLSPYLYWWRDGRLTQLSYFEPDGYARLYRNIAYEALLERYTPGGLTGAA